MLKNNDKVPVREIITHLKSIKGNDLYISGNCALAEQSFSYFFLQEKANISSLRPIFLLRPNKSNVTLILIFDGKIEQFSDKKSVKHDGKTLLFYVGAGAFQTFLFKSTDFHYEDLRKIIQQRETDEGIYGRAEENSICKKIVEIGFIQPSVLNGIFTVDYAHCDSRVGKFTLSFDICSRVGMRELTD